MKSRKQLVANVGSPGGAPKAASSPPLGLRATSKIREVHLDRLAVVYLRQSSPQQLQENRESRERQYALADCYSGYQGIELRSDSRIIRAACVVYARRKVFDASESHPLLSSRLLALFQQLYDIEDRAKGMAADERKLLRDLEGRPV